MAEITPTNCKINIHSKRMRKKSTQVNLTAMVDLGFLLITFFVFNSTMSQAKAMNLNIPNDKTSTFDPVCETCAITVVLGKENSLYYYEGMDADARYKSTDYSAAGNRNILMQKKKKVLALRYKDDCILIIKPSRNATFKNLIDMIDEAGISCIKRYYIAALNAKDNAIVQ